VIPAQVPADLIGVTMMLLRVEPLIVVTKPSAFTAAQRREMETDLNKALLAVGKLSAGMPEARGTALVREATIPLNHTVDILGSVVPLVPALTRWSPVIDAIDALLPAEGSRSRRNPALTPDQARRALGIRITPPDE
jgi:hypothetical protein